MEKTNRSVRAENLIRAHLIKDEPNHVISVKKVINLKTQSGISVNDFVETIKKQLEGLPETALLSELDVLLIVILSETNISSNSF
jgi:hypothetical protein